MNPRNPLRKWPDQLEYEAVSSPEWMGEDNRPQAEAITVTSVWQMDSPQTADDALAGKSGAYAYRRDGHPNERSLATKLGRFHAGRKALVTAQGMSAISAVALSVLRPGATVWVGEELYGKTTRLFLTDMVKWQVTPRVFDPSDAAQVQQLAESKCDLVAVETISNPRLRVPDLKQLVQATQAAGGKLMVDNTFATHLVCRPLEYGADFVVESLSKQVNGHSDSMIGLIAGRDENAMDNIAQVVSAFGLASSPLDCYLTHRGLMSLGLRVDRACANALAVATALRGLGGEVQVDYPGLADHPHYDVASAQFYGGHGWMLTFHLPLERDGVMRLFESLRPEIPFVPSLGDVSTTVSHPATTSHRGVSEAERERLGIREGTIRVSCGIEPTEWLVSKFIQAIEAKF